MNSKAYRNRNLLDVIREAPECFFCGKPRGENGTIVPCHSNKIRDGKGTGIKAHDYMAAAGCVDCHHEYDNGKKWSREEKDARFAEAWRKTIAWLFEAGYIGLLGRVSG